jgi:hypothetical protein
MPAARGSIGRDAPASEVALEHVDGWVGPRAELTRTRLHALVERQVLERVQRVVMDEDPDGALIRQDVVGARDRSVDRIGESGARLVHGPSARRRR